MWWKIEPIPHQELEDWERACALREQSKARSDVARRRCFCDLRARGRDVPGIRAGRQSTGRRVSGGKVDVEKERVDVV